MKQSNKSTVGYSPETLQRVNSALQRHFKLDPRWALPTMLADLGILLADGHDHSAPIAKLFAELGIEPFDNEHKTRLVLKIVVEHWALGTLAHMNVNEVIERADSYLGRMPWLVTSIEKKEKVKEGPSSDYIKALVSTERLRRPDASWKSIAESIAKENSIDFWVVYPKALQMKKAEKEKVPVGDILAAPVERPKHSSEDVPVDNSTKKKKWKKRR